jgi:hypothetical protein
MVHPVPVLLVKEIAGAGATVRITAAVAVALAARVLMQMLYLMAAPA